MIDSRPAFAGLLFIKLKKSVKTIKIKKIFLLFHHGGGVEID